MLHDFGTNINTGMYEMKFAFRLPEGLPQTMMFRSGAAYASVGYFTTAVFRHPQSSKVLRYKFPIKLQFKSRMPALFNPVSNRVDQEINCCCVGRGRVKGRLTLDKACYSVEDAVNLAL